jgi:uncharacterized iron-regulated membrane protein
LRRHTLIVVVRQHGRMAVTSVRNRLRKAVSLSHMWLGIIGGVFVCLMGVTGAIVTLRPTIAVGMAASPARPGDCAGAIDWARAEQAVKAYSHAEINRIYAFPDGDSRYQFRTMTRQPAIYGHVIYDACAGKVLGDIDLAWMDWLVDLHHNLLAGNRGRFWAGVIGIALLVSGVSGLVMWLLGKPRATTAFRVQWTGPFARLSRDLHRVFGLAVAGVLLLEAYSGLWLCFPQAMRATLSFVAFAPAAARPARVSKAQSPGPPAGLAVVMATARQAIPDGTVKEVRLPDGYGNVQVRMWRPGDFRSLGNNVVTVENGGGTVVDVDLYADTPPALRFIEAMAGLHYGEWGGTTSRLLYVAAGLLTVPLFASGVFMWRRRAAAAHAPGERGRRARIGARRSLDVAELTE